MTKRKDNSNSFSENFEESDDPSYESDVELYQNKQNFQTVLILPKEGKDQLFGKEGKYFLPRTYDEASLLLDVLHKFKDQKHLFSMYTFSSLLIAKIEDWPYNKLACSVLYYYLNIDIAKNNLISTDWSSNLIQSPIISQTIFSFVKRNNIVNFL